MWELDHKEGWAVKNWCFQTVVLEKTLESPLDCKEIQLVNPKGNQPWIFFGRPGAEWSSSTLATWCEEPTHWRRPWGWERLRAGGELEHRRWDGWMASLTQRTWVWVDSRSWWWTGRPGMLCVVHEVAKSWTRLSNWTEVNWMDLVYFHLINIHSK